MREKFIKILLFCILTLGWLGIISAEQITINIKTQMNIDGLVKEASNILTEKDILNYMDTIKLEMQKGNIIKKNLTIENLEKYTSVEKIKNAVKLYEKAYELGSTKAARKIAIIHLAIFLNKKTTREWFYKMIEKGDSSGFSSLAIIEENFKKKMQYIKEGIKQKDEGSAHILAVLSYTNNKNKFNKAYRQFLDICKVKKCDGQFINDMQKMNNTLNSNK